MKVNALISNVADELPKNKIKNSRYETLMADAANDDGFIQRTMSCAEDFVYTDSEVMEKQ